MILAAKEDIILACFIIIVAILSVAGNLLVCAAFLSYRTIKNKLPNYAIFSLAISDLSVGIIAMPYYAASIMQVDIILTNTNIYFVWLAFDIFFGISSIIHLAAVSIDRMVAIVYPLRHRIIFTKCKTLVMLIFVWIYAFLLSSLSFIKAVLYTIYPIAILVIGFLIPFLVVTVSYCMIFCTVRNRKFRNASNAQKQEWKLAKIALLVTLSFTLCWLPFFILNLYLTLSSTHENYMYVLFKAFKLLHYSNSCINPVIYAGLNSTYKNAFRRILNKILCWIHQCNKTADVIPDQNETEMNATQAYHITSNERPSSFNAPFPVD